MQEDNRVAPKLTTIGSDIDHPEGVCWDPRGSIIVGTEGGLLLWLDPESGEIQRQFEPGGFIGGIALDAAGRAYACDIGGHRVVRVDPDSGTIDTYSKGPEGTELRIPNYPVFDRDGRLYVSDSGDWGESNGRVIVVEPSGEARVISTETNGFTNGLALSPDGAWLYVVESTLPGVTRLPLTDDGSAGARELVVDMPRTVPDGLAFTDTGKLLITCFRPDTIYLNDGGSNSVVAEDWSGITLNSPTNVAFGGADLGELYAANLGAYHVTHVETEMRGAPLNYPEIG